MCEAAHILANAIRALNKAIATYSTTAATTNVAMVLEHLEETEPDSIEYSKIPASNEDIPGSLLAVLQASARVRRILDEIRAGQLEMNAIETMRTDVCKLIAEGK